MAAVRCSRPDSTGALRSMMRVKQTNAKTKYVGKAGDTRAFGVRRYQRSSAFPKEKFRQMRSCSLILYLAARQSAILR